MAYDDFIPPNAHDDFHWLSEGLNADERDTPRPAFVRGYARTSRGGVTPAAKVQSDALEWHRSHPLNG